MLLVCACNKDVLVQKLLIVEHNVALGGGEKKSILASLLAVLCSTRTVEKKVVAAKSSVYSRISTTTVL